MACPPLWSTLLVSVLTVALSGCAKLEDKARYYLASSVDVFAVVGGQLMQGRAQLYSDRTGTIAISTGLAVAPAVSLLRAHEPHRHDRRQSGSALQ